MKRQMDGRIFSIELCSMGYVCSLIILKALIVVITVEGKTDLIEIIKKKKSCLCNYLSGYFSGIGLMIMSFITKIQHWRSCLTVIHVSKIFCQ